MLPTVVYWQLIWYINAYSYTKNISFYCLCRWVVACLCAAAWTAWLLCRLAHRTSCFNNRIRIYYITDITLVKSVLLCNCFTAFSSHKLHHLWLSSFPVTLRKAATISASAPRTPINSSGVPVAREVCQQITNGNREGEAAKEIVSVSQRLIYPVAKWPDGNLVTGSEGTAAGPSFSCCRPWPGRFLHATRHLPGSPAPHRAHVTHPHARAPSRLTWPSSPGDKCCRNGFFLFGRSCQKWVNKNTAVSTI